MILVEPCLCALKAGSAEPSPSSTRAIPAAVASAMSAAHCVERTEQAQENIEDEKSEKTGEKNYLRHATNDRKQPTGARASRPSSRPRCAYHTRQTDRVMRASRTAYTLASTQQE